MGCLVLADLPDTLAEFGAYQNKVCGELSLNSLPKAMKVLNLFDNAFTREIHIDQLPNSMQYIDVSANEFKGDVRLTVFPSNFAEIVFGNHDHEGREGALSGTAVLRETSEAIHLRLRFKGFEAVFAENGNKHAWEDHIVEANK